MAAPAHRTNSVPEDEVEEADEQLLRRLRRRLVLYQTTLWLAPPMVIPVAIVGLTTILHVEPLSPFWYALLGILLAAIFYCGYLQALLACKRQGRDPGQHQASVIGSALVFSVIHGTVITGAGVALFFAILRHHGC